MAATERIKDKVKTLSSVTDITKKKRKLVTALSDASMCAVKFQMQSI